MVTMGHPNHDVKGVVCEAIFHLRHRFCAVPVVTLAPGGHTLGTKDPLPMPSHVPPPEPGFHPGGAPDGDFWVFAYGSLMWDPGFRYKVMQPATIRGYHRSACILSIRYRGTPERPGLVLGLDRGGACRGRAYLVDGANRAEVIDYLDNRELVTGVYKRRNLRWSSG